MPEWIGGSALPDRIQIRCTILVPAKARLELEELGRRSLARDAAVLLRTIVQAFSPRARRHSRERMRALLAASHAVPRSQ